MLTLPPGGELRRRRLAMGRWPFPRKSCISTETEVRASWRGAWCLTLERMFWRARWRDLEGRTAETGRGDRNRSCGDEVAGRSF